MHFQLSIITATLLATIIHAQGQENEVSDFSSASSSLKEDIFDDFGYYYDSPPLPFAPMDSNRIGRSYLDPYSWYFYHNGFPPSPYPRPRPPFFNFNFGPYGDDGSIWNQRTPYLFDPIVSFPYLNREPNYYDSVYGNGAFGKINGHDHAFDIRNHPPFFGGFLPFLNGPRDGNVIADRKISDERKSGFLIPPKRNRLNPGKKDSTDDKKKEVAPEAPSKKESEIIAKEVGDKPAKSDKPVEEKPTEENSAEKEQPAKSISTSKELTNEVYTEEKSAQGEEPTDEEPAVIENPIVGGVLNDEKPITEDPIEEPIEEPIENETVEAKNDEPTAFIEPED